MSRRAPPGRPPLPGLRAAEPIAWTAIAGALLFQNPFGEIGADADRQLWLQALALLGVGAWAVSRLVPGSSPWAAPIRDAAAAAAPVWAAVAALVWCAAALLGALVSVDPIRSLLGAPPRLAGFASEAAMVVLFFLWASRFRDRSARSRADDALLLAAAALVVYGLAQWGGLDPLRWSVEWQGRPTGAQGNPLFLAQALVWIVPLLASRAVSRWRDGRVRESAAVGLLVISALALVVRTGARGALLGIGAASVVWGIATFVPEGRHPRWRALAGRPLAVALVVLAAGAAISLGGVAFGADRPGTAGQRALLWNSVGELFVASSPSKWAVGFGQESLPIVLPPHLPPELPERIWRPDLYHDRAHNAALDAVASGGLLRLFASLALFGAALAVAARGARATEGATAQDRLSSVGALAALVGHAVAMQTGVATAATALLFWWTFARESGAGRERASGTPVAADPAVPEPGADRTFALQIAQASAVTLFAVWVPAQAGMENAGERRFALVAALLLVAVALSRLLHRRGAAVPAAAVTAAYLLGHALLLRFGSHEAVVSFAFLALLLAPLLWVRSASGAGARGGARESREPEPRRHRIAALLALGISATGLAAVAAQAASGVALKKGRTALADGGAESAVTELTRARRFAPFFEDGSVALTRALLREAGRATDERSRAAAFERAGAALESGRRWHPKLPLFALERAHLTARRAEATTEASARAGLFDEAIAAYRSALALDPLNGPGLRGLGAALLESGALAAAHETSTLAVRIAPRAIESRLLLARVELARGEVEAARHEMKAALALDAARVRQLLESLARSRPRDWTAFRDLGLLDLVEGRPDRARLAIERSIALATPEALPTLVRLLSETAGSPDAKR